MAHGNDARLALATHILLQANHLVSSIGAVTPPGSRQGSRSETLFRAGPVTTAVQLTFSSLTDPAEPEFLGTVPCLPDRTIVIYISRLRIARVSGALVFTGYSVPLGEGICSSLQSTARRNSDGIRACGVHRR
jgi:hypothetical protein